MSMSTSVYGIKPADEKFKKMFSIYRQCEELEVEIPEAVEDFFGGEEPDEKGVLVNMTFPNLHSCCSKYNEASEEGFEIDLSKIPEDIKIIRFVNSY